MARLNGKQEPELDGLMVAKGLERFGYKYSRIACELNGEIRTFARYLESCFYHISFDNC